MGSSEAREKPAPTRAACVLVLKSETSIKFSFDGRRGLERHSDLLEVNPAFVRCVGQRRCRKALKLMPVTVFPRVPRCDIVRSGPRYDLKTTHGSNFPFGVSTLPQTVRVLDFNSLTGTQRLYSTTPPQRVQPDVHATQNAMNGSLLTGRKSC